MLLRNWCTSLSLSSSSSSLSSSSSSSSLSSSSSSSSSMTTLSLRAATLSSRPRLPTTTTTTLSSSSSLSSSLSRTTFASTSASTAAALRPLSLFSSPSLSRARRCAVSSTTWSSAVVVSRRLLSSSPSSPPAFTDDNDGDTTASVVLLDEPMATGDDVATTTSSTTTSAHVVDPLMTPADALTPGAAASGGGWRTPVSEVFDYMSSLHFDAGYPWWAVIVGTMWTLKVLLVPLIVKQQQEVAKTVRFTPMINAERERLQALPGGLQDPVNNLKFRDFMVRLKTEHQLRPLFPLVAALMQAPLYLTCFLAVRRLAETEPSMHTGGTLWFEDLAVMDDYFRLPIITCALMILVVEVNFHGITHLTPQQRISRHMIRLFSIVLVPILGYFPQGVHLVWASNNAFTLLQNAVLKIPALRQRLNLESDPYKLAKMRVAEKNNGAKSTDAVTDTVANNAADVADTTSTSTSTATTSASPTPTTPSPPPLRSPLASPSVSHTLGADDLKLTDEEISSLLRKLNDDDGNDSNNDKRHDNDKRDNDNGDATTTKSAASDDDGADDSAKASAATTNEAEKQK